MRRTLFAALALTAMALSGCVTTDTQGYADRQLPQHPVQRMVALVAAPGPLAANLQSSIQQEARRHGVFGVDALTVFPPTRTYSDAEVKAELAREGIDAVLILTVGDTGVQREYAGTVFFSSGTATTTAMGTATTFGGMTNASVMGTTTGQVTTTATPTYRYHRQTNFQARLIEASSGRVLWVGSGDVQAGGLLFVGNGVSANSTVTAIFNDLQSKGLIGSAAS
jgi:hypothetical protein